MCLYLPDNEYAASRMFSMHPNGIDSMMFYTQSQRISHAVLYIFETK